MCLIGTGAAERKGKAAAAGWLCQPERLSEGYFIFDVHNIYEYSQPQFVLNFRVSKLFHLCMDITNGRPLVGRFRLLNLDGMDGR